MKRKPEVSEIVEKDIRILAKLSKSQLKELLGIANTLSRKDFAEVASWPKNKLEGIIFVILNKDLIRKAEEDLRSAQTALSEFQKEKKG